MKFYFEGHFNTKPRENGNLAKVSITPSTNNSACEEIFVLVAKELIEVESGAAYALGLVGEDKSPMIFENTENQTDNRILLMGDIPQPKHRHDGRLDIQKSTGRVLICSNGGGAWGSGSCFLAILNEGDRMVSSELEVWENKDGVLFKRHFNSLSEYQLTYEKPKIEFI